MRFLDSLSNLVSGLGGARDKGASNQYAFNLLTSDQLIYAYRGDWVARKAVNIPADDATREWREWQAEEKQITDIEAEEKRLDVQAKTREAMRKGRLRGGAAIYIVVEGQDQSQPLDLNRIGKGGVDFLTVLTRTDISAGKVSTDPMSKWFGKPEYYTISSESRGVMDVHPSRLVLFNGAQLPDVALSADGWGDSVLQAIDDAIKQFSSVSQSTATLTQESTISVIKSPGLLERVADPDYRAKMLARYQLAMTGKSMVNTLMLDTEEDYEKIHETFTGLKDLIETYMQIVSAAADIPVTRMMAATPGGLNASGESDLRNYYDAVASSQKNELEPSLRLLDEAVIRSALGSRPPEIHYNWRSLWQMSEKDKAEIIDKKATAAEKLYRTGLIADDKFSLALINMLVEDGTFPGLTDEAAVEVGTPADDPREIGAMQ